MSHCSQRRCRLGVPSSLRWRRSLSLRIPTSEPSWPTTGRPLMRASVIREIASASLESEVTVISLLDIISFTRTEHPPFKVLQVLAGGASVDGTDGAAFDAAQTS